MINVTRFIFYLVTFICYRLYYVADSYIENQILYSSGLHLIILYLIFSIIISTPYKELEKKVFWVYAFIVQTISLSFFASVQYSIINKVSHHKLIDSWESMISHSSAYEINPFLFYTETAFTPIIIVLIGYLITRLSSKFDIKKSDSIEGSDDIYLIAVYPKNIIGLFMSVVLGRGMSTCYLHADGHSYKFNKKFGKVIKVYDPNIDTSNCLVKNTKIKVNTRRAQLNSLVGKRWTIKENCFNIYKPIIGRTKTYL